MNKELIPSKQATAAFYLFIIGSTLVMGTGMDANQDSWVSVLVAMLVALPMVLVYAKITRLYPGKGLFDILSLIFGKVIGKIIAVLYTWYALHLGALILRNFGEFIESVTLPEMPQLYTYLMMALLCIYVAKSGIETFGKSALFFAPMMSVMIILIIVFSFNVFDFSNIQPILRGGALNIASGAFKNFTFPFAETVLFLALGSSIRSQDSPYKIYSLGILLAGVSLTLVVLRNILVLGFPMTSDVYFPTYAASKMIIIGEGDTLSRVEGSVSAIFLLGGYVKTAVCLFAASKGLASIFNIDSYRKMVVPAALTMVALTGILYTSIMEMYAFVDVYKYYALFFQVILPIIILITGVIKVRKSS